jgi:hypothetical protein
LITVSYKKEDNTPAIVDNPFPVLSTSHNIVIPNRIYNVYTGLKFENKSLRFDAVSSNENINVLSAKLINEKLFISLCYCGSDDMCFIKPNDEIAKVFIVDSIIKPVRFIDFTDGIRKIYNQPRKSEIKKLGNQNEEL